MIVQSPEGELGYGEPGGQQGLAEHSERRTSRSVPGTTLVRTTPRTEMEPTVSLDSLIDQRPAIRGGRPCIAGTGVTVRRVVQWYRLGHSPEDIAERIGHLSLAQVHAALAYYHANREAIDADLEEEAEAADTLARQDNG